MAHRRSLCHWTEAPLMKHGKTVYRQFLPAERPKRLDKWIGHGGRLIRKMEPGVRPLVQIWRTKGEYDTCPDVSQSCDPCATSFSGFVQAVCALPNDPFKVPLAHSGQVHCDRKGSLETDKHCMGSMKAAARCGRALIFFWTYGRFL